MTERVLKNLFGKYSTRLYPHEVREPFSGVRGELIIDIDNCIFCGTCQRKCPSQCITVDKVKGGWTCDAMACVYCGTCVDVCPTHCLSQKQTWRPVTTKRITMEFSGLTPKMKKEALKAAADKAEREDEAKAKAEKGEVAVKGEEAVAVKTEAAVEVKKEAAVEVKKAAAVAKVDVPEKEKKAAEQVKKPAKKKAPAKKAPPKKKAAPAKKGTAKAKPAPAKKKAAPKKPNRAAPKQRSSSDRLNNTKKAAKLPLFLCVIVLELTVFYDTLFSGQLFCACSA